MNTEKWQVLLNIQQGFVDSHPALAEAYMTLLEKFAPPEKSPCLLDLGCGEGPVEVDMLTERKYDVTGISIIPWMIEHPRIRLMDMHDLQFRPGSFDVVYSCQVMEHSYSPWLACLEVWVALRDKGVFFLVVPLPTQYKVVTHPSLLSQQQWDFILSFSGFKVIHNQEHRFRVDYPRGNDIIRYNERGIVVAAYKDRPGEVLIQNALEELTKIHERY